MPRRRDPGQALPARRRASATRSWPTASTSTGCSAIDDLAAGDDLFFAATGITDGYLLDGVEYWPDGATTYSMVMRSRSGTIRYVRSDHQFEKLERFSSIDYRP